MNRKWECAFERQTGTIAIAAALLTATVAFAATGAQAPTTLVVSVEGCGVPGGTCTSVPNGIGGPGCRLDMATIRPALSRCFITH